MAEVKAQKWTCEKCGFTHTAEVIIFPVHCGCGYTDNHGRSVEYVTAELKPKIHVRGNPSPSVVGKYIGAVEHWIAEGRPVRSDAEVDTIFRDYCKPCQHFTGDRCRLCRCRIRSTGDEFSSILGISISPALTNKLRMATEHCPIKKW